MCRKDIQRYYDANLFINSVPVIYYLALLSCACVPIYCFASGYGLYYGYKRKDKINYIKDNKLSLVKFLINFWIVLIGTCVVGYAFGMKDIYPGSILNLLGNILLFKSSYCGAWWFVQTYIILVILSSIIFKLVDKHDSKLIVIVSFLIYFVTYVQRIENIIPISNEVVSLIVNVIVLFGISQLSFVIGAVFLKEGIYSRISCTINKIKLKNIIYLM